VIAGFGHRFQHIAPARNFTIVKLAERIPQGVALRTGGVGVNPGVEIQGVLGIDHVVDPAGEAGAHNQVLEFLRNRGRLNSLVVCAGSQKTTVLCRAAPPDEGPGDRP